MGDLKKVIIENNEIIDNNELENIIKIINKYFPYNLKYDSYEYQNSKQFLLYKKKREQMKKNIKFVKDIEYKLRDIFIDYAFVNYTDWDDFKCIEFKINMHKNIPLLDDDIKLIKFLGGKQRELYIDISILEKYYYFYFGEIYYDETKLMSDNFLSGWKFCDTSKPNSKEEESLLLTLDLLMKNIGYKKLSSNLANFPLNNIETEFNEFGKVNIFDCLFTDFTIFFA